MSLLQKHIGLVLPTDKCPPAVETGLGAVFAFYRRRWKEPGAWTLTKSWAVSLHLPTEEEGPCTCCVRAPIKGKTKRSACRSQHRLKKSNVRVRRTDPNRRASGKRRVIPWAGMFCLVLMKEFSSSFFIVVWIAPYAVLETSTCRSHGNVLVPPHRPRVRPSGKSYHRTRPSHHNRRYVVTLTGRKD